MKKAFLSATLMGLLTTTGFLASAQQREQGQEPQQEQQEPNEGQHMSAAEVFARLDTNRDGKLSEAEFASAQAGASEQDTKAQFAELDSNRDKSISKEEFTAKYNPDQE